MKKICISYRGVFNFKKIKEGAIDQQFLEDIQENLDNHKTMIFDTFKNHQIDFYFSTYNLNEEVNNFYKKNLNPKYYGFIPTMISADATWISQLMHYKNLIAQIKKQNILYDYIIFTRPDLKMLKSFNSLNINFSSFNIVLKHLSGNCDDNLFILPQKFLNVFEESVDDLINENGITHSINHKLIKNSVPINYLVEYKSSPQPDGTDHGQDVFTLCR
jgi:hypothetical protein